MRQFQSKKQQNTTFFVIFAADFKNMYCIIYCVQYLFFAHSKLWNGYI